MFENVLFRSVSPRNPMKKLTAVLLLLCASIAVVAQNSQGGRFMAVDEVRPGMKGTGRTVFEGTAIQEFQVEVIGVLKNVQPKQDVILARLSGGPLEKTGVIQGMSGSPVYINGRLVGAVAYSFPYAKDPIAGIQPISQMLELLDRPSAAPVPAATNPEQISPAQTPAAFVFEMLEKARNGASLQQLLGHPAAPAAAGGGALTPDPDSAFDCGSNRQCSPAVRSLLRLAWICPGSIGLVRRGAESAFHSLAPIGTRFCR